MGMKVLFEALLLFETSSTSISEGWIDRSILCFYFLKSLYIHKQIQLHFTGENIWFTHLVLDNRDFTLKLLDINIEIL